MASIPDNFVVELKQAVNLPDLLAAYVPGLTRAGKGMKGCCPFHQEKTASFHVYKDSFHCFGCGEHGDAFQFFRKVKNLSFPDAVRDVAAQIGMSVPAMDPNQAKAAQRRADLATVAMAVAAAFERNLYLPESVQARDYLKTRGLTDETIREFRLGWGGSARGSLERDLSKQGITAADLIDVGVISKKDASRQPFELFLNRVIIPIKNRAGDVVSFGGRVIDGAAQQGPKYLNGPETQLFSKRSTLFGLDLISDGRTVPTVVEGYLDVIALHQAGIKGAVAPLGTALTLDQINAIWSIHGSPILCFDGDNAGRNAAGKAVMAALPGIRLDREFRVAILPEGEDPDSFIKSQGAQAFRQHLIKSESFSAALYRTVKLRVFAQSVKNEKLDGEQMPVGYTKGALTFENAGPTLRRFLRKALEEAANSVSDPDLAVDIHGDLLRRAVDDERREGAGRREAERAHLAGSAPGEVMIPLALANRTKLLLAMMLRWPSVIGNADEVISVLPVPPEFRPLRDAVVVWNQARGAASRLDLDAHIRELGLSSAADHLAEWAKDSAALKMPRNEDVDGVFLQILHQGDARYAAFAKKTGVNVGRYLEKLRDPVQGLDMPAKVHAAPPGNAAGGRHDTMSCAPA